MAMHATHKILAAAAGVEKVHPGEIVNTKIDIAGINDIYLMVAHSFREMGGAKVWDPDKVAIFMDHNAPSPTVKGAENQKAFRDFALEYGVKNVFEINKGICHLVLQEAGLVKPGDVVIITDSHTTTHGALGAFSTGVGSTDLAVILIEGELWMRVPEVVKINLEGKLRRGVMAKDVALHILANRVTDFANYKVLEFSGPVVFALSVEERMVLTNMSVEMGAKAAYVQPDDKTVNYVRARTEKSFKIYETDSDFEYENQYTLNLDSLVPQVALPHAVNNVISVADTENIKIDQVFIGSCTGGKLNDIEAAAGILKGRKVAVGTRLIVTMGSNDILQQSIDKGYYQILLAAGAAITTPGCGACFGGHSGLLAPGERCATTSNRNFPGRMGSDQSFLYLVSPLTAAATAVTGKLAAADNLDINGESCGGDAHE